MERLMVVASFQKAIDSLRTTECSPKEKLAWFTQISDCIQSPGLRGNANYLNYISNAVSILLMFCEDIDSVVRMSAEENLNRIIRFSTPANIVRIQYELFQELKRNGNDRSLRIALNLFGHYAHMIKQRKVKPYALNLLPCILSISQRKEQQLIETLSAFLRKFCKYFQISLTENEVSNLIEYFVKDAISTEDSVKRRCSASNVMTLIEHARRPDVMAKHALTLCLDNLVKDFTLNTIVGALGLLRILLPKIMSANPLDQCVVHKTIEIYEICLHLLNDTNHTIINASLECLCAILTHSKPQLTNYLASDQLIHMEVLCKKRTLKNQIFRRKLSSSSIDVSISKNQLVSPINMAKAKTQESSTPSRKIGGLSKELEYPDAKNPVPPSSSYDDKGLLTGSDVELDSMRLNDFELCQSNESLLQLSEKNSPAIKKSSHNENQPLKTQKSTDSIGSFLNQLMHPNTESVTKFFRVGTSSQTSEVQTPNVLDDFDDDLNHTDTNISEQSEGSMLSLNSSALGTYDVLNKTDDSIPEIEILNEQEIASIRLEPTSQEHEKSINYAVGDQTVETTSNTTAEATVIPNEVPIGSISNQPLIYYTIRLISSKFLLCGTSYKLIDGFGVRISIKNLSLAVIGHCVALCPRSLLLSLQYNGPENLPIDTMSDSEDSECLALEKSSPSKDNNQQAAAAVEPSDELNIKDDHFGENSKVPKTYFDFSFPLSKSADNVLLSRLTVSNNMMGSTGSNPGDSTMKRTQKLSGDLNNLLSKSEIIESNRSYKDSNLDVATELDIESSEKLLCNQTLIQSMTDSSPQFVEDLLLFWDHSDPMLRANVQTLVGNFLFNVLNECNSIANYIQTLEIASTYRFLNFNVLFHILMKGLTDEIHTVVKQSLISLEKILSVLLDHRSDWFYSGDVFVQPTLIDSEDDDIPMIECKRTISPIQLLEEIFEQLPSVFENKYWVIQNRYCHFVAAINYDAIEKIFGHDKALTYKNRFISQIYQMLRDSDARIRNEAANALFELNCLQFIDESCKNSSIVEFAAEILSNEVPFSLNNFTEPLSGFHLGMDGIKQQQVKRVLGKYLFDLANMLFALKSSEQLLGTTKCLLNTMKTFHPIQFVDIWCEYNILEICIELLTSNYSTGTDLSCQCDLLTISSNLLAAIVLRKSADPNGQHKTIIQQLIRHVMKLLSIYYNVLNNKRPVFIPKGQKSDLFVNSRELQLINSYGYFGNDYFYLKIYKIVRIIYENYKITINEEIDAKLFSLLNVCLKTMALLLEIVDPFTTTEMTIFFDEILMYLKTFLVHVIEPKMSVICIKHSIRNMFQLTFPNWKVEDFSVFDFERIHLVEPIKLFDYLDTVRCQMPVLQKKTPESTSTHAGSKLINFLAATSTPEKHKANTEHRNIKLFEPIVIQCLKLFTKSDAEMQSYILDMLCQVLQLKVNYCLLDANNIFMDFILKLIESIEMGIIRNSDILTPKVVKFLFFLAKQKEKPQMSIPKIINITDNLLANSITNNGSVEALYHLAFEIYFPRHIDDGDSDEPQHTAKELNTTKEVVLSMLLKFFGHFKIKRMVCMILAKESNNSKEIHAELTESMLHTLGDEKPFFKNLNDYYVVKEMCNKIHPNLLGKSENTSRLLARFQKCNDSIFDDVAVKSIILDCISQAADENAISKCISPEVFADCVQTDLSMNLTYTAFEYNVLFEGELSQVMEYLHIFGNYLLGVTHVLRNCDKIGQILRRKLVENRKNCESLANFMRNLSALNSLTHEKRTNWCAVKSKLASQFFTLVFDLYDASQFLEIVTSTCTGTEMAQIYYDRCVISHLIEFIVSKLINDAAIELLLKKFFTKVLLIAPQFITCVGQRPEFLELVVNKFGDLLKLNTSQKDIPYLLLDILEASQSNAFISNVKQLFTVMEIYRNDAAIVRRSFKVLNDKLRGLSSSGTDQFELISALKQFKMDFQHHEMFFLVSKSMENVLTENHEKLDQSQVVVGNIPIDENWFIKEAIEVIKSKVNKHRIFEILSDVKSEQKLNLIYETTQNGFGVDLLSHLIARSIDTMIIKFKHDCFQHNPHMNYLKLSPILKQSINLLCNKVDNVFDKSAQATSDVNEQQQHLTTARNYCELKEITLALRNLLACILNLQLECMVYVDVASVNKFINEHIFRRLNFERLTQFAAACLDFVERSHLNMNYDDLTIACDCLIQIIRVNFIFNEPDNYFNTVKCHEFFNRLLVTLYEIVRQHVASHSFLEKNQLKLLLNKQNGNQAETSAQMLHAKAIFLGAFVEHSFDANSTNHTNHGCSSHSFGETLRSLIVVTMQSDLFYFFAVTPREIINSFEWQSDSSANQTITFQSVPIDCLNEIDIVEKFLKRINIFGFPSRQHFEEFFMSLLVLINKENDVNIVDAEEEYQIKGMCMLALLELLISCKMFPKVGDRLNGFFHHVPRSDRLKADSISSRKLHEIQNSLMPAPSVFYISNLEYCNQWGNNIIGTHEFQLQQYELNVIWHVIEGQPAVSRCIDVELKNMKHFIEMSLIDFASSIQLTFDVLCQLSEVNCIQILPHIVKFSELCENRDHFHWIKDTMSKLHESIPLENVIAHQHIAYCLCRSYAILIPSLADLNHLCPMLREYLKSSHLFVRVAVLKGLLLLFESCIKSNTTIGSLSEEILMLRTFISSYITQYGIVEESALAFSNEHNVLVWTLNFYIIESTSKYIPDCEMVTNTIISANNVLKRTASLALYSCIIHGLERVIISKTITRFFHEKIEKLALDLVKLENEQFSLLALKLLVTCMYIGANDQLENTEKCNGIVQDEPEVIMLSTEKIEILFQRIKLATRPAAHIYGNVLCQMTHDLVPPKEVLTKVIKEFLTVSQPHCEVIAKVLFEVFRSAIDSAYLPMLQDWLLCSLPNFLSFTTQKIMWYLIVIFISASINLNLIKIFPQVLADYKAVFSSAMNHRTVAKSTTTPTSQQSVCTSDDRVAKRQQALFAIACKDFYDRLNSQQKSTFRDTFSNIKELDVLNAL